MTDAPMAARLYCFKARQARAKSALLGHFVRAWRNAGQDAPVVVGTESTHFANERTLALRVADAADPAIAAQFRHSEMIHSTLRTDVSDGTPGVVSGSGRQATSALVELSLTAVQEALSASERSVVLILDEAQDLDGLATDKVLPVISRLHKDSHGGPFLAVFASLAHSSNVLRERGISRFPRP